MESKSIKIIQDLIGREMFRINALQSKTTDSEEFKRLELYCSDLKKAEKELLNGR